MSRPPDIAGTPEPPYFAVIFTSVLRAEDEGYEDTAARMVELGSAQPGFLGIESIRANGLGITVSYWASEEAIREWKRQLEHREAQRRGREDWYARYTVRVARVERAYSFEFAAGGEGRSQDPEAATSSAQMVG